MGMTENKLKKEIGFTVAMSLVIGTVIGSGVFMKPGKVIEYAGDSTMALWAWILGGIITLAGGLTIAEVSSQIPKTGGLYVYLEEVYGKVWGYLSGWVQTIIYGPAIIGALGLYFGSLLANLFSLEGQWKLWLGIGSVVFLGIINSIGTKYGGIVQTLSTVGKLIPIALIIVFGIWKGNNEVLGIGSGISSTEVSLGAAVLATLWAYDGWMLVGFVAGEMKNPAKLLPRAIITGLSLVTAIYLLVNVALLQVLPADKVVALGENAAGTAASVLFGDIGGKLISIGILVSIFGCLNGKILTFPRVPYAMAEREQLPGSGLLSRVHDKFGTPVYATTLQIVFAVVMMIISNPDRLSEIAIFSVYLFYIQAFFAVFILRKRNRDVKRVYSVPLYPLIPIVAIIGSGFVVISTIFDNPQDSLLAIGITLAGLPVYFMLQRGRARNRKETVKAAG
ncbi:MULTISPECIES: APC family permease [Aneurinibacillus]|jgi:APA family basic amino acid/polyamine antiporter|uniref:Serine/threonine exchanger SteT n=1 Tax=Aneurinibacillus danicus TaxID=267746 RepID=A0A511V6I6_9BACL|nr:MULTISPECIES: amino acid permease [Aneurinibacillus]GEN34536.1 serine/threonine exchanger SteT [Aneurinibacillus danicus]